MFIPLGKPVHENLATRYLLIDALIEDLCEQSFAGLVTTKLPDEDYNVMVDEGKVVAVLDSQFARTNLATVVSRCRAERGSASIYAYPQGLAMKFAARLVAEPLYVNLSADFADLEKLIVKLMREIDRRWFIEVTTGNEHALIYISEGRCGLITAAGEMLQVAGHTTTELQNSELKELIEKCHAQGGSFDVLFQRANEEIVFETELKSSEKPAGVSDSQNPSDNTTRSQQTEESKTEESTELRSDIEDESAILPIDSENDFVLVNQNTDIPGELAEEMEPPPPFPDDWQEASQAQAAYADVLSAESAASSNMPPQSTREEIRDKADFSEKELVANPLPTHDLMAALGQNREALEGLKMAEVKRLMGKILKTVGDIVRLVDQRDNFNLHLRAGQLKVAERFPFLDPFGSEFEYLDGEIAFIGHCDSDYFIHGLTEALKIAITEAAQSSAKSGQLRTLVNEELQRLLETNRQELELYHLDAAINEITGRQLSKRSSAE